MFDVFFKFLKSEEEEKKEHDYLQNLMINTKEEKYNNTFYGSYFKTHEKIKQTNSLFSGFINPVSGKELGKNKENSKYFGAFLNEENLIGEVEKCSIPLIYKENILKNEKKSELELYLQGQNNDINYTFQQDLQEEEMQPEEKITENKINSNNPQPKRFSIPDVQNSFNSYNLSHICKTYSNKLLESYNSETRDKSYLSYMLEESIILNPFKVINYETEYRKSYSNIIYDINDPIDMKFVTNMLITLLQEIPSELFKFNQSELSFEILDPDNFRFITCNSQLSNNFIKYFIESGNKMFLIQLITEHFLYKSEKVTLFLRNFYSSVNSVLIKVNEQILNYRNLIIACEMNLIKLLAKVNEELYTLINTIYHIFNLPSFVEKYKNQEIRNLIHFIEIYENENNIANSHYMINALFNFMDLFQQRDKNYFVIKSLLITGLKSYFHYIYFLIFNNEIIDSSSEYFIFKDENNNISILDNKVPNFLQEYKHIILNNIVLLNLLNKHDTKFYQLCNYKLKEFITSLQNISFDFKFDKLKIEGFKSMKENIFNKKFNLMWKVSEHIFTENLNFENEEKIMRINQIQVTKNFMSLQDIRLKKEKEIELSKKRKFLEEIKQDLYNRNKIISDDIAKIKAEEINLRKIKKEREILEDEIKNKLKEKYSKIMDKTNKMNEYQTDDKNILWKRKRIQNRNLRYELFGQMFDENTILMIYPIFLKPSLNYHSRRNFILNEEDVIINIPPEISIIKEVKEDFININNDKMEIIDNNIMTNKNILSEDTIKYPKFFIKNIMFNEILTPIIEAAMDLSEEKNVKDTKYILTQQNKITYEKEKEIKNEMNEIMNKIQFHVNENLPKNIKDNRELEFPMHIILNEFCYDVIVQQFKFVSNSFYLMLKNKFYLKLNFDFMKDIFLGGSGHVMLNFIEYLVDFKSN